MRMAQFGIPYRRNHGVEVGAVSAAPTQHVPHGHDPELLQTLPDEEDWQDEPVSLFNKPSPPGVETMLKHPSRMTDLELNQVLNELTQTPIKERYPYTPQVRNKYEKRVLTLQQKIAKKNPNAFKRLQKYSPLFSLADDKPNAIRPAQEPDPVIEPDDTDYRLVDKYVKSTTAPTSSLFPSSSSALFPNAPTSTPFSKPMMATTVPSYQQSIPNQLSFANGASLANNTLPTGINLNFNITQPQIAMQNRTLNSNPNLI
jgi:hypothetical protein